MLTDQGALKLDDVLKNVAGVTPGGYYSNWDYYRIRGFDAAFNTFLDGLRRQNVATADLANPGYYTVAGEQRSRGLEFDGRFSPRAGWELTFAYAYTDARIMRDNSLPVGARTPAVPYHGFNVWTKYILQQGVLKGFGAGLGCHYYSCQLGDSTYVAGQEFELPAYGLVDAALYWSRDRFRAQLNASNLFDREYYSGAYDPLYVLPGMPRTIRASVAWKF